MSKEKPKKQGLLDATMMLPIEQLERNEGQFYGLPKNPRLIRDERFEALKKSIQDAPDMLDLRELLVYPMDNGKYIVIGGNMRLAACIELGFTELPCKIIRKETPVKTLREITIKDNEAFGQPDWTTIANEWDMEELADWGMELNYLNAGPVNIDDFFEEAGEQQSTEKELTITIEVPESLKDKIDDIKASVKLTLQEWGDFRVK